MFPIAARELAPPGGGRAWPRIVHRLDRGTSGCLLLALRKSAEEAMKRALDQGTVEKTYLALVHGAPPDSMQLDTPYGPDPRDKRRYTTRLETPRRARLRFEVVERRRDSALLRIQLDTGRTHQIRVQLSESGFPVVGDDIYGNGTPAGRLMLHAERLAFPHPESGLRIECISPVPGAFTS